MALAFGRTFCSNGRPEDGLLRLKYYATLAKKYKEFVDSTIVHTNPTALKEKLINVAAKVVEEQGVKEQNMRYLRSCPRRLQTSE